MTPSAIGLVVRALRLRRGWRQADLAEKVGIGQPAISAIEAGNLDAVSARTLARTVGALGGELRVTIQWQGGDLDRLLDRAHADLVERIATRLRRRGWDVHVEVSFSRYGERGSIDVLGWHPGTRTGLIVEVKSAVTGVEDTLRLHDVKVRLAPVVLRERLGVVPEGVGRLLVVPDNAATHRRIEEHRETFARAYPARGRDVARWLARPAGPMAGILFMAPAAARPRRRVSAGTRAPRVEGRS